MVISRSLYSILIVLSVFGCNSQPVEKVLSPKNPTSVVFRASLGKLSGIVRSEFDGLKHRDMILASKNSLFFPIDTLDIFDQHGNENDFLLYSVDQKVGLSYVYSGYEYFASFHLHLIPIDLETTKIEVRTIRPRILLEKELVPSLPHFARRSIFEKIQPSTIEEYEILHKIGTKLGQQMAPISFPKE